MTPPRTALAAGLLALAMLTTGCVAGTTEDTPSAAADQPFEGEVEFWTINLKKNFNDYVTGLITQYRKEHPKVTVKWVDVPGQDSATKLLAAMASGDVPDAVNLGSPDLGRFIPSLAPMDDYFKPEELADFQPNLVEPLRQDGKLYGVPWYNGGAPVAMYRKSVVSKAGFDEKAPPKTYDEALALAAKVYDDTKVYGTNEIPGPSVVSVLSYYGVTLLSEDKKKAAFNTPEVAEIIEKFKKSYDEHGIAPGSVSKDIRALPQSLDNGQVAFTASANGATLVNIQKNAPDIYKDLVVTEPVQTAGGGYLLNAQQTFTIPKASRHKKAAAEFIKFFTNGANQLAFCKIVPIYPSTISSTKDSFFTGTGGTEPMDVARQVIVKGLPKLEYTPLGTAKDTELAESLAEEIRAVFQGQKSVKDALDTAEKNWNDALV
ncbi:multiple sugar transport system substrate-binding protein/putative chitobiose transport system substrate-binding protein [Streptosporangium album]|uniref:Multiple sugar transport system substrate-binding protein/putative chitobiose transport system substrate-binding protein n=1 Tax=Streptosporangium album TaxID=47479 RepID=A0A7W7S0G8_9ACTN|nr:sugar ABC transporter substrate-binding protein [Streptosporangium album]MBB4941629.1 multiple sugar transport system substrate-binding protein/putative chitobiose transport system substrate-binding protein [Streptosporangium album]